MKEAIKRNLSIDLVKIIGMYMVMLIHTGVSRSAVNQINTPIIYTISGIAIPLFFMVSGYLLSERKTDITYSLKKILGITRFCIIICFFFDILKYLITNYFELSFPKCWIKEGTFSVFWYFGAMIIIYLILPLLQQIIQGKKFYLWLSGLLFLDFIIFILNYYTSFEESISNTFRIWNWITYFMLGGACKKYFVKCNFIQWYYPIIFCLLFTLSVIYGKQPSYELHFSSPLCMLYALSTFITVIKTDIKNSKMIKLLSQCFLPIYAIHMSIIWRLSHISINNSFPEIISFLSIYIMAVIICTIISLIIMKTPLINRIFRI